MVSMVFGDILDHVGACWKTSNHFAQPLRHKYFQASRIFMESCLALLRKVRTVDLKLTNTFAFWISKCVAELTVRERCQTEALGGAWPPEMCVPASNDDMINPTIVQPLFKVVIPIVTRYFSEQAVLRGLCPEDEISLQRKLQTFLRSIYYICFNFGIMGGGESVLPRDMRKDLANLIVIVMRSLATRRGQFASIAWEADLMAGTTETVMNLAVLGPLPAPRESLNVQPWAAWALRQSTAVLLEGITKGAGLRSSTASTDENIFKLQRQTLRACAPVVRGTHLLIESNFPEGAGSVCVAEAVSALGLIYMAMTRTRLKLEGTQAFANLSKRTRELCKSTISGPWAADGRQSVAGSEAAEPLKLLQAMQLGIRGLACIAIDGLVTGEEDESSSGGEDSFPLDGRNIARVRNLLLADPLNDPVELCEVEMKAEERGRDLALSLRAMLAIAVAPTTPLAADLPAGHAAACHLVASAAKLAAAGPRIKTNALYKYVKGAAAGSVYSNVPEYKAPDILLDFLFQSLQLLKRYSEALFGGDQDSAATNAESETIQTAALLQLGNVIVALYAADESIKAKENLDKIEPYMFFELIAKLRRLLPELPKTGNRLEEVKFLAADLQEAACSVVTPVDGEDREVLFTRALGKRSCANPLCATFGSCLEEEAPRKKCQSCRTASYCGAQCQKEHWVKHKHACKTIRRGKEVEK